MYYAARVLVFSSKERKKVKVSKKPSGRRGSVCLCVCVWGGGVEGRDPLYLGHSILKAEPSPRLSLS